jgi:predicted choloylglycine hydrolase
MHLTFRALAEKTPGPKWQAHYEAALPAYKAWFLSEGNQARPTYARSVKALKEHMPELMPTYEALVDLAGGGDMAARLLSLYCPAPYLSACSQLAVTQKDPYLVRNYDYSPSLCEGALLKSSWTGRPVMAMIDCLWGVLDGMNEAGLCVSLAFGGRPVKGTGFGIPLVLRYILELCETTAQALVILERIPVHMTYNVTVLDKSGTAKTAFVAPDRPTLVIDQPFATNHQGAIDWPEYAHATDTVAREAALAAQLETLNEAEPPSVVERFLEPPLYTARDEWGTLYTAIYRPRSGEVELRWPRKSWRGSFRRFKEGEI